MKRTACVAAVGMAILLGSPIAAGQSSESASQQESARERWERLQREAEAARAAQRAEQERYEQGVRDAEAARARYEAEQARHQTEVERAQRAQADYDRQMAEREAATETRRAERGSRDSNRQVSTAAASSGATDCQQQRRRSRNRGRALGGLLGGVAGGLAGRGAGTAGTIAAAALSLPVGALLGEAFAALLDCREQEQAAVATQTVTEEVSRTGVGTTSSWTSETRENVTGSSTVTAMEQEPGGGQCLTVTDIVIIDGEETRAPKRMCRRPPANRFVRV